MVGGEIQPSYIQTDITSRKSMPTQNDEVPCPTFSVSTVIFLLFTSRGSSAPIVADML